MFVGRKKELEKLNQMYDRDSFEFAVIYGRRRVGKTTLITEFCKGKKAIYYSASESIAKENLAGMSRAVYEVLMPGIEMPAFDSFDSLFDFITYHSNEKIVFAIDEYPYLAEAENSISSQIQIFIDHKWKNQNLMLILCGSSMSFMEYQVLGYKSPLYGRRTAQFKIQPFTYFETRDFATSYSNVDQAILYGVTGGIPEYLNRFSLEQSLSENIISLFFTSSGMLFEEPISLLKQELRNFAIYNAVIGAIATGSSRLNEIATKVGEDSAACVNQLNALMALGLIKKERPITENINSKRTIYRLEDSMFSFWYQFVFPNISNIERGMGRALYEHKVKESLNDFMGPVFEKICIDYLYLPNVFENAPFFYGNIGRWWGSNPIQKRQEEIDILGIDGDSILLGECKWTNKEVDFPVLSTLMERGNLFSQKDKWYYLFAKTGFTKAVLKQAEVERRIRLIRLEDMV